jgi:CBS domain containing-hemolysin-like protein
MHPAFVIILSLICCAFAAGMEIAFVSANKLRIALAKRQGRLNPRIVSFFVSHPSRFIATMLVANTVALTVYGIAAAEVLRPFLSSYISATAESEVVMLILETIIATFVVLVFAEFIPKVIFRNYPNIILTVFAIPTLLVFYILYPVVVMVMQPARWLIKIASGKKVIDEAPVFGRVDLDHYIGEIMSRKNPRQESDAEIQLFRNALGFSRVKVRECMIPRPEMVVLSVDEPIEALRELFIQSQLSKILIFRGTVDNIIGFVHSFEMFRNPPDILASLMPVSVVPESMPASELLTLFTRQHKSIAVVVDEFGGTSGLVTLEDVMEEIFGEIYDEHDKAELVERKFSDHEFVFSGRLEVDYLNTKYNINIPVNAAYETLGGFILYNHESVPEANQQVIIKPFTFSVLKMDGTRIALVRIKIEKEE